jgi:site-specific DNA recombinase
LQQLLAEVRAGKVDVIVVYKVDRLTRSLADFAKLVDLFDQHSVSFVSVTQSFNTTSSMGRLTSMCSSRSRSSSARRLASGCATRSQARTERAYGSVGQCPSATRASTKLVVVPEEAETVRWIFRRYLELGSVGAVVEDLERKGIQTRRQVLANGQVRCGVRFGVGRLTCLLRNRFYIGEIAYRGAIHPGEQEPIID